MYNLGERDGEARSNDSTQDSVKRWKYCVQESHMCAHSSQGIVSSCCLCTQTLHHFIFHLFHSREFLQDMDIPKFESRRALPDTAPLISFLMGRIVQLLQIIIHIVVVKSQEQSLTSVFAQLIGIYRRKSNNLYYKSERQQAQTSGCIEKLRSFKTCLHIYKFND